MQNRSSILVNFFIRSILGLTIVFFANQFLASKGVALSVGLNPWTFLTTGTLGVPGVALLYGMAFYQGL